MHRIVIVCRLNAARSVLVAAALRTFFPQYKIVSCGTEAVTGAPYPEITLKTAEDWGLTLEGSHSVNICDVAEGLNIHDLILISDQSMKDSYEISSLNSSNIFSFEQFAISQSFVPLDPIGLNLANFKKEIAKAIFCASKAVSSFSESENNKLNVHILITGEINKDTFKEAIDYCRITSSNLLIANFEVPSTVSLEQRGIVTNFLEFTKPDSFHLNIWESPTNSSDVVVIQAKYETNFAPKDSFSIYLRDSIDKLSKETRLTVLYEFRSNPSRVMVNQILMASALIPFSIRTEVVNESLLRINEAAKPVHQVVL